MKKIIALLALLFPTFAVSGITAQDDNSRPVITRDNTDQVELLHVIGRSRIYDVDWSGDGEHIAVFSADTVTVHDAGDLSNKQVLQMEPCTMVLGEECRGTVDFSEDSQTLVVGSGPRLTTYDDNFNPVAFYEDDLDKSVFLYSQQHDLLIYGGGPYNIATVVYQGFDPTVANADGQNLPGYEQSIGTSRYVPTGLSLSPNGQFLAITHGALMLSRETYFAYPDQTLVYDLAAIFQSAEEGNINFYSHNFAEDKTIQVLLEGNSDALTHVTFSPDGTLLAGAGQNGQVRLWSMPDGAEVAVYDAHFTAAWDVAFSPDGTQLVSAGGDGTIRLRDVATGEETLVISGLSTAISTISYNPDGSRLVAGGWDGSLRIFDTATGEIIEKLEPLSLPAWVIAFSPDGTQFAIGTDGNDVVLFDVIDEPPFIVQKYIFERHESQVYSLAFHPDEPYLASGGSDGMVYVWNTDTGEFVEEAASSEGSSVFGLAYSPNTGTLQRGTFFRRDNMGELLPPVYDIEFSPDGSLRASSDVMLSNPASHWDVILETWRSWSDSYSSSRTKLTFSADGSILLSAGTSQDAYVWRIDDLTNVRQIQVNGLLALSPDGSLVAGGNLDIYDAVSGEAIVSNRHGPPYDAVFSPDGALIVTSSVDGVLRFWGIPAD